MLDNHKLLSDIEANTIMKHTDLLIEEFKKYTESIEKAEKDGSITFIEKASMITAAFALREVLIDNMYPGKKSS